MPFAFHSKKASVPEAAPAAPPRPRNTHTIEIERFVPVGQIDPRYFEKPYYVTPREPIGQEAFAVIRDAMRRTNMAGLARIVLSSRERPILLEPMDNGIRGETLRFAHEVRAAEDYFAAIPEVVLPPEMLKLAEHIIIETKAADFDPSMLEDHYRTALVEMLRKKQEQLPPHTGTVKPSAENVVSLMDALRHSIQSEQPKKPPITARSKRQKGRKRS